MASAEELRQRITANRLKLRGALEAAAGSWESGDDEGWSARTAAEHCIDREVGLAGIAAAAMRGEAPELRFAQTNHPEVRPALSFATAPMRWRASMRAGRRVMRRSTVSRPAELVARPLPKTLEGVMQLVGWHLDDHAQQIARM